MLRAGDRARRPDRLADVAARGRPLVGLGGEGLQLRFEGRSRGTGGLTGGDALMCRSLCREGGGSADAARGRCRGPTRTRGFRCQAVAEAVSVVPQTRAVLLVEALVGREHLDGAVPARVLVVDRCCVSFRHELARRSAGPPATCFAPALHSLAHRLRGGSPSDVHRMLGLVMWAGRSFLARLSTASLVRMRRMWDQSSWGMGRCGRSHCGSGVVCSFGLPRGHWARRKPLNLEVRGCFGGAVRCARAASGACRTEGAGSPEGSPLRRPARRSRRS